LLENRVPVRLEDDLEVTSYWTDPVDTTLVVRVGDITLLRAPIKFGRLLADYARNLINLYSVNVTSLAAFVDFVAVGTITVYTRRW
jgi:hypothetical protein